MSWVRRDDQASIHRKVAPLDDATYRLWSEAIEWCSRNTTDGRISKGELATVSRRASVVRADTLVRQGLWHRAGWHCVSDKCPPSEGDGWVVHDYLDYQPSREKVRAEQAAKAERQRKWQEKRRQQKDASQDTSKDASQRASPDVSKDDAPSPPRPEGKRGGDHPEADADRRDAAAGAADVRKPPNPSPPYGDEDPHVIAADQRRLIDLAAERQRLLDEEAERSRRGRAAVDAAMAARRDGTAPA